MRLPNIATSSLFVTEFDAPLPLHLVFVDREPGRSKRVLVCVFLVAKSRTAPGFDDRLLDETVLFWDKGTHATMLGCKTYARTNERLHGGCLHVSAMRNTRLMGTTVEHPYLRLAWLWHEPSDLAHLLEVNHAVSM